MTWLAFAVFATDVVSAYMAGKYIDARATRSRVQAVVWDGLLSSVVALNLVGFVKLGWLAVPLSVSASMLGTWLSFEAQPEWDDEQGLEPPAGERE